MESTEDFTRSKLLSAKEHLGDQWFFAKQGTLFHIESSSFDRMEDVIPDDSVIAIEYDKKRSVYVLYVLGEYSRVTLAESLQQEFMGMVSRAEEDRAADHKEFMDLTAELRRCVYANRAKV